MNIPIDILITAYCGMGIGMCARLLGSHNILYKEKELTQLQYILFVFIFSLMWPARFRKSATKQFKTVEKKSGNVLPL